MPTFDGSNLLIVLDASIAEVDAKADLYSAWKAWLKVGANAKYSLAFDTVGGDSTTAAGAVSPFFFLRNDLGWRIRPAEEDANVTIVGNLYGRDPALPVFVPTSGAYTVLIAVDRDASSVVETVTSGSGVTEQDKIDIANLTWAEVIDGAYTSEQLMRVLAAAMAGKLSGSPGPTITIRDISDTKDRIVATVDEESNRTEIVLDVT